MKLPKIPVVLATAVTIAATMVVTPTASAIQVRSSGQTCTITITEREHKIIELAMANAVEKDLLAQAPSSAKAIRNYFSSVREAINTPSNTMMARAQLRLLELIGSGLTQEQLGMANLVSFYQEDGYGRTLTMTSGNAAQQIEYGLGGYWLYAAAPEAYPNAGAVLTSVNATTTSAVQACADGTDTNVELEVQAQLGGGSAGSSGFSLGSS